MEMLKFIFVNLVVLSFIACTEKEQSSSSSSSGSTESRRINGMEFVSLQLPNQLEVLIVSDSRFKQSSAAMAVGVGSMEDPLDAQGMAHYLEHMLFLGTKEFPQHDEYSTYMEKNGGWDNAYTSDEITNYFFEVDNAAVEGALHRFSRFFVSPIFDATYVDREKNAVNSEFEKNIKNDSWRQDRFVGTLAAEGHPFGKFSTGNKNTLKTVNRDQVIEFYKKYYSANNMRLVVMSSQPVESLKKWVHQYFKDIPQSSLQSKEYPDQYFRPNNKKQYHFVKSITDIDELTVLFNIVDDKKYWESKPLQIIAKIIGDESQGSLLSYLKRKGWALSLSAGESFWRTFAINVTLTPSGRKNHVQVVAAIYAFLGQMKSSGYPEYIYEDEKNLQKIALDNLEPSSSGQRSAFFARALLDYSVDSFLEKQFLITKYSKDDFEVFLNLLNPANSHVMLMSQKEKTSQKENIFGVEYLSQEMPKEVFSFPADQLAEFKYPSKNEFIPNDFSLVGKNIYGQPYRQVDEKYEISVAQDTELGVAKAFVDITFLSHVPVNTKNTVLNGLFTACKMEELKAWGYPISEAKYDYEIDSGFADSINVGVSGYSQHLFKVLNSIINDEKNGRRLSQCQIDEKLFNEIKLRLKKDLMNKDLESAASAVSQASMLFSYQKAVHWKEYVGLIDQIRLSEVQKFGADFFGQYYLYVSGYGNLKKEDVISASNSIYEMQKAKTLGLNAAQAKFGQFRTAPEKGQYSMRIRGKNNNNAMLKVYQARPWTLENHAKMLMFSQLISQAYFAELRTNQQLGYVARAYPMARFGFVGLGTVIQSQNHAPQVLEERSQKFIQDFTAKITQTLTDAELQPVRQSLVNELRTKPNTMAERFDQFSTAAMHYRGRFNINQEMSRVVEKTTVEELKTFIAESFKAPSTVAYYYFGEKAPGDPKKLPGQVFEKISDVNVWKYGNPYLEVTPTAN